MTFFNCLPSILALVILTKFVTCLSESEAPYRVIWNSPTETCTRHGVYIDYSRYQIETNTRDFLIGSKITLFYNFGLLPHYKNGKSYYGGVPQLGNITAHFEQATKDIQRDIPNSNFNGVAVIDWESWRPVYDRNWDSDKVYQRVSEDLVRKRHPKWSQERIITQARKEFEAAAKEYMQGSLRLAQKLRPNGKWGFYLFPECYNYGYQSSCDAKTLFYNDQLSWLFNTTSGMYPSGYIKTANLPPINTQRYVMGQSNEALRVRARSSNKYTPIFLYSTYMYGHNNGDFYSMSDLVNSVGQIADLGLNGVTMWGSGSWIDGNKQKCIALKKYVDERLGPYVLQIVNKTKQCSKQLCNSNGRCVLKPSKLAEPILSGKLQDDKLIYSQASSSQSRSLFSSYKCQCYKAYHGGNCSN